MPNNAAGQVVPVAVIAVGHCAGAHLLCDVSRGAKRPVVPLCDRRAVFRAIHGVAHPGIRATHRMISARFVWHGLSRDVGDWCRDYQTCQHGKVTKQPPAPLQEIPVTARHFSHVHVDLVGPLPPSEEGHMYLLTVIDRSTRWVEAMPLKNMETATCVENFVARWVARFGVPASVLSDRGAQFTSAAWVELCTRLGIQHMLTTAYHPQSNGMVERVHRQLKEALRALAAGAAWHSHLPWVLLGLRAAPKEESGCSSAEMMLGMPLQLPGELLLPEQVDPVDRQRSLSYAAIADSPPAHLASACFVYVRRGGGVPPLAPLYWGPYEVLAKHAKTFWLRVGGHEEVVSVDRLKAHTGPSPVVPAPPPSRGRPPAASHVQPATL